MCSEVCDTQANLKETRATELLVSFKPSASKNVGSWVLQVLTSNGGKAMGHLLNTQSVRKETSRNVFINEAAFGGQPLEMLS